MKKLVGLLLICVLAVFITALVMGGVGFVCFQFIYNVFTQNVYIDVVYCRQAIDVRRTFQ